MQTDRRTKNLEPEALSLIFERLHQKVVRRSEDDKHQAERHQRRAVEDLRSKIKRLSPSVVIGDTWEQVRPRVEKLEEYRILDSDDLARSAFDKVIRRLKEKAEEHGSDRRDRERNGDGKRLRTRTPEMDAYEADRRKAQAARERNYGKRGASGLSPPPRARDRDDRYDGRKVSTHYERERRDREGERERSYTSRADPRDRTSELDYGDGGGSRPTTTRRRRESDVSARDVRDTKVRLYPHSSDFCYSLILHSALGATDFLVSVPYPTVIGNLGPRSPRLRPSHQKKTQVFVLEAKKVKLRRIKLAPWWWKRIWIESIFVRPYLDFTSTPLIPAKPRHILRQEHIPPSTRRPCQSGTPPANAFPSGTTLLSQKSFITSHTVIRSFLALHSFGEGQESKSVCVINTRSTSD